MLVIAPFTAALLAASAAAAWGEAGCELAQGTAAAEAAPLVAPTLFGHVGFVNAGEAPVALPD